MMHQLIMPGTVVVVDTCERSSMVLTEDAGRRQRIRVTPDDTESYIVLDLNRSIRNYVV